MENTVIVENKIMFITGYNSMNKKFIVQDFSRQNKEVSEQVIIVTDKIKFKENNNENYASYSW